MRPLDPDKLVETVVTSLDDDKAEDILVIDLRGRSSLGDHLVIATGRSQRQVGAMADHLLEKLKRSGLGASIEGAAQGDWVLIDGGDIVVHLFRPEVRSFYNLEGMWGLRPAGKAQSEALAVPAGDVVQGGVVQGGVVQGGVVQGGVVQDGVVQDGAGSRAMP